MQPTLPRTNVIQHPGSFVFRPLQVKRAHHVAPHLVRVTLGGPEARNITSYGMDDDIRIQIPEDFDAIPLPPVVHFNPLRLIYPDNAPPSQMRAITIRRLDPDNEELDLEFVMHGEGIAARWAAQATPGQHVNIGGPRTSKVLEGTFDSYLFIGDATALPAIGRYIESLPAGSRVTVVAEVESPEDALTWSTASDVDVTTTWLPHQHTGPDRSDSLEAAVHALPRPAAPCFIFCAGESARVRQLRRQVIADWNIDKRHLSFAGYWKRDDDTEEYFVEEEVS